MDDNQDIIVLKSWIIITLYYCHPGINPELTILIGDKPGVINNPSLS